MAASEEASGSVSVITVAYNSFDVLPSMADTLPPEVELIIVDNGQDDGLRTWAEQKGHLMLVPEENIGFGNACNLGAAKASSDFLFFLNPDALLSEDTIPALLEAAGRHPDASAFGPAILGGDGSVFSVNPSVILPRTKRGKRGLKPASETALQSLNGAALLVRRQAFEAIGGFDPEIFLFFEDDDLGLRLSGSQGPLIYVPSAKVTHASGGSSGTRNEIFRLKGYHFSRSYVYVLRKHGRRFSLALGALSAFRRLLSLRIWYSQEKWHFTAGRVRGILSLMSGNQRW